jgi:hypothetical protein
MSTHSRYRRSQQPAISWPKAILAITLFAAIALAGLFVLLYAAQQISPAFALISVGVLAAYTVKRNWEIRRR